MDDYHVNFLEKSDITFFSVGKNYKIIGQIQLLICSTQHENKKVAIS